ncbi:hypothetical protein O6H91_23G063900 [Diphasiastrum complanatum]|uniref:Uncharacterized protein n=1 Tax=Diphasiastrum complanatum TaxID=34168 RepID=A0ACC2ABF6_DIPCM|nr:hypothetical protein O6H91_23G063900 [Diphasiastrum complanatum]
MRPTIDLSATSCLCLLARYLSVCCPAFVHCPHCLTCDMSAAPRCLTCLPYDLLATSALCVLAGGRLLSVCDPCTSLFRLVSDILRPVCDLWRAVYSQNSSQKSVCDQNS